MKYLLFALLTASVLLFAQGHFIPSQAGEPTPFQREWSAHNQKGLRLIEQGRFAEAEKEIQQALEAAQKIGPQAGEVGASLNNLADLHRYAGHYEKAIPLYKQALPIAEKTLGPNHPNLATILSNQALCYTQQKQLESAEPLFKRSLLILGVKDNIETSPETLQIAVILMNSAEMYRLKEERPKASRMDKRAFRIAEKALPPNHPTLAKFYSNITTVLCEEGLYAEAEPLLVKSIRINEQAFGEDSPLLGMPLHNLAIVYVATGKTAQAKELLSKAYHLTSKHWGMEHPETKAIKQDMLQLDALTKK